MIDISPEAFLPHGKFGKVVLRRWAKDRLSVFPCHDYSDRKPTSNQKVDQGKWKQAVELARQNKNDPAWLAACQQLADQRHMKSWWNAAMSLARSRI